MRFNASRLVLGVSICSSLLAALALPAQTSTNYQLKESVLNSGGDPAQGVILASANYKISLSSLGEGLSLTGLSSSGYRVDAGFSAPYPPPGEVLNLIFTSKTTFGWNAEVSVGTYSVYRGLLSSLPTSYGSCLTSGLTTVQATDATLPSPGQCFIYLVTAKNRLAEEGTMGKKSDGTPRPNGSPCP